MDNIIAECGMQNADLKKYLIETMINSKSQAPNSKQMLHAGFNPPSPPLGKGGGGGFGHWKLLFGDYLVFGLPARSLFLALKPHHLQTCRRSRTLSEAPRASARGIFTALAKPAEAHPPTLKLRWIPFSHSSPSFRTGHSAKAGKRAAPAKAGIWNLGFLLFLLFVLFNVGCQRSKAGITVAGSTSVEPFAELLAEEYMSHHPKSHIYVQGGGSTAGIEAVMTRAANIGMSSRNLIGDEKKLYAVTIAKDAIAIIVNPKNPVQDLSLDQIRQVFSGNISNWKEVGGPSHTIVLVTREEGSGTRESFQKFVMGKEDINLGALVQDSNGAVRQVVSGNHDAIGYISLGLVNDQVKALKISGVEPNLTDIDRGKYTLVRPFLFVFEEDPMGEAKSFLEFVLSPTAQKLLLKEGLVPVLTKISQE